MRKWLWIAPILLAAGCSKNQAADPRAQQPIATAQTATVTPPPAFTPDPGAAAEAVAAPENDPVIPGGTLLRVRVDQALSTRRSRRGDRFTATLMDSIQVDGQSVLPSGTRLSGRVLVAAPSGRLKGRARLVLALTSFERDGHRYSIETTAASRVSRNHKKRNVEVIGGSAGTGAAIGAIAGGGPGALIGAGAGAVAGTVGAALTGKKQVSIPAETVVRFTLGAPVRV